MPRINCSVESCYYNKQKICEAEVLNIGGKDANITESTCCETYKENVSCQNAVGKSPAQGATEEILCSVGTCAYNIHKHCSLSEIEVSSLGEVDSYKETDCLSFERAQI